MASSEVARDANGERGTAVIAESKGRIDACIVKLVGRMRDTRLPELLLVFEYGLPCIWKVAIIALQCNANNPRTRVVHDFHEVIDEILWHRLVELKISIRQDVAFGE